MTPLQGAILGLLAMRPGSGYDLMRIFETTPMGHFSGSPGAVYPALSRLEQEGSVESVVSSVSGRSRKTYSVTADGHKQLAAWLREPVGAEHIRDGLDLALLRFSLAETALGPTESVEMLRGLRRAVKDFRSDLLREKASLAAAPFLHPRLAVEHGIMSLQATVEWADWAIDRIGTDVSIVGAYADENPREE